MAKQARACDGSHQAVDHETNTSYHFFVGLSDADIHALGDGREPSYSHGRPRKCVVRDAHGVPVDEDGNYVDEDVRSQRPRHNRAQAGKPFRNYTPQVPFPPDLMLSVDGTEKCPRPCDTEIEETRHDMMSIVGSLLWVARMTQIELAPAAAQLGRVTSASGHEALRAATQMVQYSHSQLDRGIRYRSDGNSKLQALCDASDKPDPKDGKGTMGVVGFLYDMPIFAKATKTPRVGMSSTHCEYMAATECTKTIVYCHELLKEMGFPECCDEPTPMGNDNWQAVTLVGEDRNTAGNRWYLTEVAYCKEKHREGYTLPYWVETNHNGADIFTKPLSPQPFLRLRPMVTGYSEASIPYPDVDNRPRRPVS